MDVAALQSQIDTCKRCVEIGGPTLGGYEYLERLGLRLPDNVVITNLTNPVVINPLGDNPETYPVDEIADITDLPYAPGSIDLFLTSSFPKSLRKTLLENTAKALRTDGLLVFENVLPEDDDYAQQQGFAPLLGSESLTEHHTQVYQSGRGTSSSRSS